MEESWRFRPIQGNTNLCPTCSTSHFPFCTPHQYHHHPLPFDHNNGFGGGSIHHRLPNDPSSFQRPFLGNHVNMPPPPPSSYYDDHTKFMTPMIGNPNFVRKFPESPMVGDSGGNHRDGFNSQFDYGSNRFVGGEFVESDRSHKRIKVDEMNSSSFAQIPAPSYGDYSSNQNRPSLEDERRLSLIREHGRKGSVLPGFGNSPNGRNEHREPHHYGQINHTTLHSNEPSIPQMGAPHFVDPTRRDLELPVAHGFNHLIQRELYNSNSQQPNVSHSTSYPISQASHEQFRAPDSQRLQSKDYDPAKDPQNLNFTSWPLSSGSNMPNHEYIHDLHYKGQQRDVGQSFEGTQKPMPHNFSVIETFGSPNMNKQGSLYPTYSNNLATRHDQTAASWAFGSPPLPPVSPPPFPMDPPPPPPPSNLHPTPSPQKTSSLMYSIPAGSSISPPMLHSSAPGARSFPLRHPLPDKPKRVDVSHLLRRQYRATRPDHIVIILRGLPGSGKSYLAKMLRDLEVENGGDAPRIHSMDDYFMTEVEKIEEREGPKASNSVKGRKTLTKTVIEYCYEPEMEEAYRASMLKAFKKTLEEGNFTFIIVDDRNLRVADFAQFWATAKRSGYEVYLLEATYKDPVGCAARNVHGFTSEDIQKMAKLWEEAPSLYLQLDSQSLFQGDALDESGIQEVDMDMDIEDVACDEGSSGLEDGKSAQKSEPPVEDYAPQDLADDGERWDTEKNDDSAGVKELGRSKWSHDDEEDVERSKGAAKGKNSNALSGLIQAYNKGDKSVHWGDQVDKTGFSIAAAKKAKKVSLVIGPGAGYNLTSNPLLEGDKMVIGQTSQEINRRCVFQEHLRAERESFRAVFDRRRHRIGGLDTEDD